jgi:hypothetical protein
MVVPPAFCNTVELNFVSYLNREDQIEAKQQSLRSLFSRRDKVHAHLDNKYFYRRLELPSDAPLSLGDLRNLIKLAGDILNEYSVAYNGAGQVFRATNTLDVKQLLDILVKHISAQKGGLTRQ